MLFVTKFQGLSESDPSFEFFGESILNVLYLELAVNPLRWLILLLFFPFNKKLPVSSSSLIESR